jgi:Amt family ammonium transporter
MRVTVLLRAVCGGVALAAAALPVPAWAASNKIDNADTAWMLVATGLVLMMSIPALALFYCGMVRRKNVLSTMGQSFVAVAPGIHLVDGIRIQPRVHRQWRLHG